MALALNDMVVVKVCSTCKPVNLNLSNAINILHYQITGFGGTGCTEQQAADAFSNLYAGVYLPLYNLVTTYYGVLFQKIFPGPPAIPLNSAIGRAQGAGTGENMPLQNCGALTKLTAFAGRKFRGRVYVPFPTEDFNTPQATPTAPYIGLLNNMAAAMVSSPTVGGGGNTCTFTPVIFHPGVTPTVTALTAIQSRLYWTTQRRRNNAWRADTLPF